jgi:hypothetical protein
MTSLSLNKEETILEQMNKLHDMEVLTCKDFLPNQEEINWEKWNKHIETMKNMLTDINWNDYTKLDLLMSVFLWYSGKGFEHYQINVKNKTSKLNIYELDNYIGNHEFYIILDGYIKNNIKIPYDLILLILNRTYKYSFYFLKSIKYCFDNKIRILKFKKNKYYGLKPDCDYDFQSVNYKGTNEYIDWIEEAVLDGFLNNY